MRGWIRSVVMAALGVSVASAALAGDRECAIRARVRWVDVLGLAPFAYRTAAAEARRILAEQGICAELARASASSIRTKQEIGIVLLRAMPGPRVGRRVMGATRSQDAGNATVWVYFDEIVATLGLEGRPTETWSGFDRMLAGRALGRVAAHEIVHVLLPDRPHDRAGLMSPSLGRRELTASVMPVYPDLAADVLHLAAQR